MTISSTVNTVSYTGNGSTTAFPVNFVFFGTTTSAELEVVEVVIATGAETVRTNGTHFTVSGGSGTTGTVTAATAPATTVKWVINRKTTQHQETDYVENDPFPAESHEEALDRLTATNQEQERALGRTAQLPDGFTGTFDPTLPTTITANTALVINADADGFAIGPTTSAITAAQTQATNAENSASAAASSASSAATILDNFDDRYLGSKSSDPSVDNDGDALATGALYFNTSDNVTKAYTGSAWVRTTPTSTEQGKINTVAADFDGDTDITSVADNLTNITSVADNASNINTVAADGSDIGTVAGIAANVSTVAGISANVTTVAGIAGDVSAVAAQVVGYDFSTTTAMADPGNGNVRFNNATLSSVSQIAIDDLDKNGVNQSAYIILWDDSTNTIKGSLVFRTAGGDVATFNITGLTDNSGWSQIAVTHVASSGTFSNGEDTFIGFNRAGDKGADGEGAGDLVGPSGANANAIPIFNGTTGKLLKDSTFTITAAGGALIDDASAEAQRNTLSLGTSNSPQFTAVNVGAATDTTVTRVSAGVIAVEGATLATLSADNVWTGAQRPTVTNLTSSSNSIAITLGASNDFKHTFTEATTLANPSDTAIPGQSGSIYLTQHASSPKTLAFGSEYDFVGGTAPTITAVNDARDRLDYVVQLDGKIQVTAVLAFS